MVDSYFFSGHLTPSWNSYRVIQRYIILNAMLKTNSNLVAHCHLIARNVYSNSRAPPLNAYQGNFPT